MSNNNKKAYLQILLNIKKNCYENNLTLLKLDLLTLEKLILIDSENERLQLIYSTLTDYQAKRLVKKR